MVAAFIAALLWKPVAVLAIVVLVCGLAAVEFFEKVSDKGYRPASIVGITASICAPLAAYWVGDGALPLVFTLALMAAAGSSADYADVNPYALPTPTAPRQPWHWWTGWRMMPTFTKSPST